MSGDDIQRVIRRISHEILETHSGAQNLVLIGIHTRGVPLAAQLARSIEEFESVAVPFGSLGIGDYRDDKDTRAESDSQPTQIPFPVDGKHVVIVDDVLFTGRTIRASLDALSDLGRAATIEVAVMVDRGHRELPVRADYVGKNLPTSRHEVVRVRLEPIDDEDGVWIEELTS